MNTSSLVALSVLAASLFLLVTGCDPAAPASTTASSTVDELVDGPWHLVALRTTRDVERGDVTARFEERAAAVPDTVTGTGSSAVPGGRFMGAQVYCVSTGWFYVADDVIADDGSSAIRLGLLGARDVSCGTDDRSKAVFIEAMEAIERYDVRSDTLRMFVGGAADPTAVFVREQAR